MIGVFDLYENLSWYFLWDIWVEVKIWKFESMGKKILKSWSEECLDTKAVKRTRLKNMDLLEYSSYSYKNLILSFDLTFLLYIKIWGWSDLKVRSYESFSNQML